ncbi:hypothetical protein D3C75_958700 [compost metagenome]
MHGRAEGDKQDVLRRNAALLQDRSDCIEHGPVDLFRILLGNGRGRSEERVSLIRFRHKGSVLFEQHRLGAGGSNIDANYIPGIHRLGPSFR